MNKYICIVSLTLLVAACGKSGSIKGSTFKSTNDNFSVTFISDSELELNTAAGRYVLSYEIGDEKIRAVGNIDGSKRSLYFKLDGDTLISDNGEILLSPAAYEKVIKSEDANRTILLNAKQLLLSMEVYRIDKISTGANHIWPTEVSSSRAELAQVLVKDTHLTEMEVRKLTYHLLIGKVCESDPPNTIIAISDNFPGSPIDQKSQYDSESVILMTKSGEGNILSRDEFDRMQEKFKMPELLR
jgi:hypothetical protein